MADSASKNPLSGLKDLSPQARKGMIVFGLGVVVVLGGTALWASKRNTTSGIPASVKTAPVPDAVSDPNAQVSPEYKKLLEERDHQRFEQAAAVPGQMVTPSTLGLTAASARPEASTAVPTPPNPLAQVQAQAQAQTQGQPQQPARTQQMEQRDAAQYASMMKRMGAIADRVLSPSGGLAIIVPPPAQTAQAVPPQGQAAIPATAVAQQATGVQAEPPAPLLRAASIVFATIDTAVNTDFSGPVIGTIQDGRFKNARLIGSKTLEQDAVVVRFNLLSPADGSPSIPIEAYAIRIDDAKKFGLTGLSGHTDYHVIQRYVLPAAAVFVQAYGAAASQPSQTVVQTAQGIVQTTPQLSTRDRMITATGAAVQPIVNDLARSAGRPVTQELDANTEIGVLFARDVVPQTAQASATNPAAPVTPPQPQAVSPLQPTMPVAGAIPAQYPVSAQPGYPGYGYPRSAQPAGIVPYPSYGQQYNTYQR